MCMNLMGYLAVSGKRKNIIFFRFRESKEGLEDPVKLLLLSVPSLVRVTFPVYHYS